MNYREPNITSLWKLDSCCLFTTIFKYDEGGCSCGCNKGCGYLETEGCPSDSILTLDFGSHLIGASSTVGRLNCNFGG